MTDGDRISQDPDDHKQQRTSFWKLESVAAHNGKVSGQLWFQSAGSRRLTLFRSLSASSLLSAFLCSRFAFRYKSSLCWSLRRCDVKTQNKKREPLSYLSQQVLGEQYVNDAVRGRFLVPCLKLVFQVEITAIEPHDQRTRNRCCLPRKAATL